MAITRTLPAASINFTNRPNGPPDLANWNVVGLFTMSQMVGLDGAGGDCDTFFERLIAGAL